MLETFGLWNLYDYGTTTPSFVTTKTSLAWWLPALRSRSKRQSMSSQTVLLRTTLTRTIVLYLIVIFPSIELTSCNWFERGNVLLVYPNNAHLFQQTLPIYDTESENWALAYTSRRVFLLVIISRFQVREPKFFSNSVTMWLMSNVLLVYPL